MNHTLIPDVVLTFSDNCCKQFAGIAYDGQFYYLTSPADNRIYKYNRDFILCMCFEVNRPYSAICFDHCENCFWVWDQETDYILYKLDCSLEELCFLELCKCRIKNAQITGLSFNCHRNTIMVSFPNVIAEYSKNGDLIQILQKTNHSAFTSVLSLFPYFAVVQANKQAQLIKIFSVQGQLIQSYCFAQDCKIEDIIFTAGSESELDSITLIIIATDPCCCPCILKCKIDLCGLNFCPCGKEYCHNCCISCKSVNDLLESIAMMETAMSHILNAEGEKLQKAVELAHDICDLLEIDKAVNKTITNITFLEQTLYAKLEAVSSLKQEDC